MPLVILSQTHSQAHADHLQAELTEWSKWGDNYMGDPITVSIDDDFMVEEGRDYVVEWAHTKDQRRDIEWQVSWCLSELNNA
jgi:hypothetical protein